jgi:hypothetical protein
MKIDFEGRTWSYDESDITVTDAEVIEKETGGNVIDWSKSLAEVNARSYKILYWLMRSQSGDPVPLDQVNFRLYPFVAAINAAIQAEVAAAAAGEPDPTAPPSTQAGDSQPPVPLPSGTATASQPG